MKARWTYNLSEQHKEDLRLAFAASSLVRERLTVILQRAIEDSLSRMRNAVKEDKALLTESYIEELAKQTAYEEIIELLTGE